MPNGSQMNMYLPNIENAEFALSWSSFTCQKPELASNTENTLVIGIQTTISLTVLMG